MAELSRVEDPSQREQALMKERLLTGIPVHSADWAEPEKLHARLMGRTIRTSAVDP